MEKEISLRLIKPQFELYSKPAQFNLIMAGQGGGKSYGIGIMSGSLISDCCESIGLVAANTYDQLSRATLKTMFEVWKKVFGYTEYDAKTNLGGYYVFGKMPPPHFKPHGYTLVSNNNNIYTKDGGVIFTASLDNFTAIEGIEIGWALLDETADTKEEAVKSVILGRLRQKGLCRANRGFAYAPAGHEDATNPVNPLFIFTKPAKVPWLNEMFGLEDHRDGIISNIYDHKKFFHFNDGQKQIIIYSAYLNQKNLPPDYIEGRKSVISPDLIASHIYGDPFAKTGDEFVPDFDAAVHVKKVEPSYDYPLHVSIDFNAKPYMSALLIQLIEDGEGYEVRVLDEYALQSPKNTAGNLAIELEQDYSDLCEMGLFVYGDASGNNSIPIMGRTSFFDDFTKNLTIPFKLRVPKKNPSYASISPGSMGRKAFINSLFSGGKGVKVVVDPKCQEFIADLKFCKEDANGKMKKEKDKDGVELRGHHLDAFAYFVCHPAGLGKFAKMPKE